MKELSIFLKALENLHLEEGKYIIKTSYHPTSVNAIKNYQLEVHILNKGESRVIAKADRNYNVTTNNKDDLCVDVIVKVLKHYGIK